MEKQNEKSRKGQLFSYKIYRDHHYLFCPSLHFSGVTALRGQRATLLYFLELPCSAWAYDQDGRCSKESVSRPKENPDRIHRTVHDHAGDRVDPVSADAAADRSGAWRDSGWLLSGGTASNVITYIAEVMWALSVGMTITSTLAAPIVTPLLVYVYPPEPG